MNKRNIFWRAVIISLILFWVAIIYIAWSGDRFRIMTNDKGTNQRSIVWRITGTGADTSMTFVSQPVMTIFTWCADTTADDSVSHILSLQVQGSHGWYTFKTTTITAESTDAAWLITEYAVPSGYLYRLIDTGGAANSKLTPSIGKFTMDGGR